MGNPTGELRAKLDELGVEHYDHENGEPLRDLSEAGADPATSWRMDGASVCAVPNKQGTFDLWIDNCTPEQAIAATVGGSDVSALRAKVKAQSDYIEKLRDEYKALKDQTERRFEEYRDTIRKLKAELDAATVGAGTCKLVIEKRPRHGPWIYHFGCGYDFWQPTDCPMPILKHCPNCGKRIVEEEAE